MSVRSAARDLLGYGNSHGAELAPLDQHSSQQELREREELLRLAVEATGIGIWDMELPSARTEWSMKLRALAGLTPDAPVDDELFYSLVHPDDRDHVATALETAISFADCQPYSINYRIHRKDTGEERWWQEWSRLVPDASGKPARVVGTIEDVTERKRAELERQCSEKRWSLGLSAARMVAWEHDPDSETTKLWDNGFDLLGFTGGDTPTFLERVHTDDRAKLAELLSSASRESTTSVEFRFRGGDGIYLWLRTSLTSVSDGQSGRIVGVISDITERKAAEEKLFYQATHDAMTGLLNRAALQSALDRAIAAATERKGHVTLAIIDIDHFKEINDTLGHDAGDCLLRFAANVLRDVAGSNGVVGRLGGDEFAILVEDLPAQAFQETWALSIQERLREGFVYLEKARRVAASLGLATFPEHASFSSDILKAADLALYAAKRSGRARLKVFTPELLVQTQQRSAVLSDVQRALLQREFVAFYQPKVDLVTGAVIGFEALARWRHPTKGLLTPTSFGVAFEDSELATEIDRAMVACIVNDMQRWHALGLRPGRISLNLSSYDFADGGLADTLLDHLANGGIGTDEFEVEVTETVLLESPQKRVAQTLEALRNSGVKVSLDDFGTGFSSLVHLKRFTVDEIKIDKSFISNVVSDENDFAIVEGVIGLANALKLTVVAEGIETRDQLGRLASIGCGFGQGYLFAKPMLASRVPWFTNQPCNTWFDNRKRMSQRG
ncbi:putative bifunctional diguanylate cyclase/phosphodiesterase [Mesorhizobium sp. 10J20-29]